MSYDDTRKKYRPKNIKILLIAESPPPSAHTPSSRHFYRTDAIRPDDRLFINTIKALYPEAANLAITQLEEQKETWLRKFQADGWYMIESLEKSLKHEVGKPERQELIRKNTARLLERIKSLASHETKIILIKSNVFDVLNLPLRKAGFNVLNNELVDYPGHFNQTAYRQKLAKLATG